jgi:DNA polymerase-3 subunit epsilon
MNDQDKLQTDAARLDAHEDYRVLRRIPPSTEWHLVSASGQSRRGLFVDVETTGLDTETDEIIEVALLPFDYDPSTGDVIAVHEHQALDELRDPGIPIPAESTQVHGITDDDVKGNRWFLFTIARRTILSIQPSKRRNSSGSSNRQ